MNARRRLTVTLTKAIKESGESLGSISRATGIDKASLFRFVNGQQSLRLDKADALAAHFNLILVKGE